MRRRNVPWLPAAAVALAFQAAFLGGATAYWSRGLTVALIGLALVGRPPERHLGRFWNALLLLLLVWSLVLLLPLRGLGLAEPAWRMNLRDYALDLPRTISPQPWLSAEGWLYFLAGIAAFYWFATLPWQDGRGRSAVRLAGAAAAAFAGACLLFRALHYEPPFWRSDWHFGPFPSRNHTGNLLALGALLCGGCAVADWARKRVRACWFLAGLVLCGLALAVSLSRGAMLTAAAGVVACAVWLGSRRRTWPALALALAALVLAAVGGFYLRGFFPGRLAQLPSANLGELFQFRLATYGGAARMIAAEPLAGVGFGNFEPVFPMYRTFSGPVRLIHPESDWFWAGTELGWPGAVLLAGGVIALLGAAHRSLRDTPVTSVHAAVVALGVFVLHSGFDVPAHLFGTALPALLLAGVLVARTEQAVTVNAGKLSFRGLGVLLACAGVWLAMGHGSSRRATVALREATQANQAHDFAKADAAAKAGLDLAPLDWQLRFQRGIAQLGVRDVDGAQASFKSARMLQPGQPGLPESEAGFWMALANAQPLAEAAWRDALACDPSGDLKVFDRLLDAARETAALRDFAREQAFQSPARLAKYLARCEAAQVAAEIGVWRTHDPDLKTFRPEDLEIVLNRWAERNPREAAAAIREHPSWRDAGWRVVACDLAAQGQLADACAVARMHLLAPAYPVLPGGSREQLRLRLQRTPADFAAALALSHLEESAGDLAIARFALRKALEQKDAPPYLAWRAAELASRAADHDGAWMALRRYGQF